MPIDWIKALQIVILLMRALAELPPTADHRASVNALASAIEVLTGKKAPTG